MATSKKVIENSTRLRYIRSLERFHKSMISFLLNSSDITKDKFDKKLNTALKLLNRVETIQLYKGELQDLQKLVEKIIAYKDSKDDIEDIKSTILYASNQLDKSKNAKRYKKDKHTNTKYKEWE